MSEIPTVWRDAALAKHRQALTVVADHFRALGDADPPDDLLVNLAALAVLGVPPTDVAEARGKAVDVALEDAYTDEAVDQALYALGVRPDGALLWVEGYVALMAIGAEIQAAVTECSATGSRPAVDDRLLGASVAAWQIASHVKGDERNVLGWSYMLVSLFLLHHEDTHDLIRDLLPTDEPPPTRRHDDPAVPHSVRFRKVSTRYPRRVAEAYGRDLSRAMADTDEEVAATVAAWELANGQPVRDWQAIGREERADGEP